MLAQSVKGALVAQWVKHWPTDLEVLGSNPTQGKIFSTVNRVPVHTAYHNIISSAHSPVMTEILLKRTLKCKSSIHSSISVAVVALLFYVHSKHLRSCRDGQLT